MGNTVERKQKQYYWDFNTVEQVLISCAILVCLAGIMFESDRFQGSNQFGWQGDLLTYLTILLIFFSIFYYICVVSSEICGCVPKCLQKLLAKKEKHHRHTEYEGTDLESSDDDDEVLFSDLALANPRNLNFHSQSSKFGILDKGK